MLRNWDNKIKNTESNNIAHISEEEWTEASEILDKASISDSMNIEKTL